MTDKKSNEKEFTRKLKIDEYVFEIDGQDILDVELKYSFNSFESAIYKDGKKLDVICKMLPTDTTQPPRTDTQYLADCVSILINKTS